MLQIFYFLNIKWKFLFTQLRKALGIVAILRDSLIVSSFLWKNLVFMVYFSLSIINYIFKSYFCTKFCYVVQTGLSLIPPECWDYGHAPLCLVLMIFFSCVWVFYLHVCLCSMYIQFPQKPEKDIRSLGVEFQTVVIYNVESNAGPRQKQPVLLTTHPSL